MDIVFLVLQVVSMIFAGCFLLAAVLTFATHDMRPLDRETDRALAWNAAVGGTGVIWAMVITHEWRRCPLGRRLFYTAVAFGVAALACGYLSSLVSPRDEGHTTHRPVQQTEARMTFTPVAA